MFVPASQEGLSRQPRVTGYTTSVLISTLYVVIPLHEFYVIYKLHIHIYVKNDDLILYVYVFHSLNAAKTKYMVMSREQTAGLSHTMKVDNSSIERVEEFKYLGTTLTNENSIQEEIKSRLKLENACYHSVQNLLSSSLLSKNLKIKIYRTVIFPVVLYGCETWSLTLREEHRLRVF